MEVSWREHFEKVRPYYLVKDLNCICEIAMGIESLLKELFKDYELDLNTLINMYLSDFDYRDSIHSIRLNYNAYKHSDGISELKRELEQQSFNSKYIIPVNKLFTYIYEKYNYNTNYQIELMSNQSSSNKYKKIKEIENDEEPIYDGLVYNSGYLPFSRLFKISNIKRSRNIKSGDNINPIICVIHNILSIGPIISKSEYLKTLQVSNSQLEKIYNYEILVLNLLMKEDLNNIGKFAVSPPNGEVFNYAIKDIQYYYSLINEIVADKYIDKLNITYKLSNSLEENIEYNNTIYSISYLNDSNQYFKNSFMFAKKRLEYSIDDKGIGNLEKITELVFGHSSLREGQKASLLDILNHNNDLRYISLSIMPTGYGKSLVYQLISVLQPVINIVISPSDILIEDQIINARDMFIYAFDKIENYGKYAKSLLYYSTPLEIQQSRIRNILFDSNLNDRVGYIFFDEVHQLSIWGQRFDPDFLSLANYIVRTVTNVRLACFTATATRRTIIDLKDKFQWHDLNVLEPCSMVRGNLTHKFIEKSSLDEIFDDLVTNLNNDLQSQGLVMVINNDLSILAKLYKHISKDINLLAETIFFKNYDSIDFDIFRRGIKRIILATDNFTIGINVSKLKKIYTIGIPISKEWYYQETGRVCRDETTCQSIVYYLDSLLPVEKMFLNPHNSLSSFNIFALNDSVMLSNLYESIQNLSLNSRLNIATNDLIKIFDIKKRFDMLQYSPGLSKTEIIVHIKEAQIYNLALYVLSIIGYVSSWYYTTVKEGIKFIVSFRSYFTYHQFMSNNSINSKGKLAINDCRSVQNDPFALTKIFIKWFDENVYLSKRLLVNTAFDMCKRGNDDLEYAKNIELDLKNYFMLGLFESSKIGSQESLNKMKSAKSNYDLSNVLFDFHDVKKSNDLTTFRNKCLRLYEYDMNEYALFGQLLSELSIYNNMNVHFEETMLNEIKINTLQELFKDYNLNSKSYSYDHFLKLLSVLKLSDEDLNELYVLNIDGIKEIILLSYLEGVKE